MAKVAKALSATYKETAEFRERGEAEGRIRVLLAIDGKDVGGSFSMRADERVAWAWHQMMLLMIKGESPKAAFAEAFPNG